MRKATFKVKCLKSIFDAGDHFLSKFSTVSGSHVSKYLGTGGCECGGCKSGGCESVEVGKMLEVEDCNKNMSDR